MATLGPEIPAESVLTAWAGPLADALQVGVEFASKDQARPILRGVAFDHAGPRNMVVATDSYRLIAAEVPVESGKVKETLVIDRDDARTVAKALRSMDGIVAVKANALWVTFQAEDAPEDADDVSWIVPRVQGPYPQWKALLPQAEPDAGSMHYRKQELVEYLKRAVKEKADYVDLICSAHEVSFLAIRGQKLSEQSIVFEEDVASGTYLAYEEKSLKRRLNPKYLLSVVQATDGAGLGFNKVVERPVMANASTRLALVMPVRFQEVAAAAANGG